MKILFIGDVVAKTGRGALAEYLPEVMDELSPDCVIVNAENAAHGLGMTGKICDEIFDLGVDCITSGNHAWDKAEIVEYIEQEPRLIRPLNYPEGTPGAGHAVLSLKNGQKILVANAMGRLFMDPLDDPFIGTSKIIQDYKLTQGVDAIFVDIHAETTSEKMAFGHYLDGQVSAVVGTHTHIPTADAQILDGGTAYQTDAGMTGSYNSVIGFNPEAPIKRFTKKMLGGRLQPSEEEGTLCGSFIITDDRTGLATSIQSVIRGPRLTNR